MHRHRIAANDSHDAYQTELKKIPRSIKISKTNMNGCKEKFSNILYIRKIWIIEKMVARERERERQTE